MQDERTRFFLDVKPSNACWLLASSSDPRTSTYSVLNILWRSEHTYESILVYGAHCYTSVHFLPQLSHFFVGRSFLSRRKSKGREADQREIFRRRFSPHQILFSPLDSDENSGDREGIINKNFRSTRVYKECMPFFTVLSAVRTDRGEGKFHPGEINLI